MRRSVDGGGSWGPIVVVADYIGDGGVGTNTSANPDRRVGNPSPLVDATTGRVFVLFAVENAYAFVTHSDDEGGTWSGRRTLGPSCSWPPHFTECKESPLCCLFGPGVGGGAQVASSGRLVALSERQREPSPLNRSEYAYSSIPIYSDDGGTTWSAAAVLPVSDNRTHGLGEPSVASVGGGGVGGGNSTTLIMCGRSLGSAQSPHGVISSSLSHDGGLTWEEATPITTIGNGGCQASVVASRDGRYALISSPVYPYGGARYNATLFLASAASGFKVWTKLGVVRPGPAGYSSLARSDATVGVATQNGVDRGNRGMSGGGSGVSGGGSGMSGGGSGMSGGGSGMSGGGIGRGRAIGRGTSSESYVLLFEAGADGSEGKYAYSDTIRLAWFTVTTT